MPGPTDTHLIIFWRFMGRMDMKWRFTHPFSSNYPIRFEKVFKERVQIFERYLTAVSCVMNHYE